MMKENSTIERDQIAEDLEQDEFKFSWADDFLNEDSLNEGREEVLELAKQGKFKLEFADAVFKKDREVVLEVVKHDGWQLRYAEDSLKKDKEVVLAAVTQNGMALAFVDDSLTKDRDVVLAAVRQDGIALNNADDSLKKDREIVLEAIKSDVSAFAYADESLKKDKKFVLEAVKLYGLALYYADKSLKKDENTNNFSFSIHRLQDALKKRSDFGKINEHVSNIIGTCAGLFLESNTPEESKKQLFTVLDRTIQFISSSKDDIQDYQTFSRQAMQSPWSGMQLLGKLMMGLSLAIAAVGIGLSIAIPGVAIVAASVSVVAAVGFFAGGAALNQKGKREDESLLALISEPNNNEVAKI